MKAHYLDNSATTKVSQKAADAALFMMTEEYANPSSLHSMGLFAEIKVEEARQTIARSLGVDSGEIYFTSGGTEANNLAIFGVCEAKKRTAKKIITTAIEHSSVLETVQALEKSGYEAVYLRPCDNGQISYEQLYNAVDENTALVSMMAVNNETGLVLPFDKVAKIIKDKKSPASFHCDCVQAYGKICLKPKKFGADLVSVSAHKVHGAKGVGALYIRKGERIIPRAFGGEQQSKIRPGTESSPLICAFSAAVNEFDINGNYETVKTLCNYTKSSLLSLDGVLLNSPDDALPYIINISLPHIKSETMLHFLENDNVFVSSASACSKGKPSYVLKAMGLSDEYADSAIRISFSKFNTKDDADALLSSLNKGIARLQRK